MFIWPHLNTRGIGRILDSKVNLREFSQPRECLGYISMEKKVFYCFYKIFLKINSKKRREIVLINFLIQKYFLNTCFRQSSFLLTNQNAHLIMNEPIKFRVTKVKIKIKFVDIVSEQTRAE